MDSDVDLLALPAGIDSGDITAALIIWVICFMVSALPSPSGGKAMKSLGSFVSMLITIAFVACIVWAGWALVQSVTDGPAIDTTQGGTEPWDTVQEAGMRAVLIFPALFISALWRQRERWLALAATIVAAGTVAWLQLPFFTDWLR
ncbi:hypothetical protein [Kytococcus sp. Marseille-QA3725]